MGPTDNVLENLKKKGFDLFEDTSLKNISQVLFPQALFSLQPKCYERRIALEASLYFISSLSE